MKNKNYILYFILLKLPNSKSAETPHNTRVLANLKIYYAAIFPRFSLFCIYDGRLL